MENKMSKQKISKLIIKMGIPMIFSMVLQALYNVIDTIFVINSDVGTLGNAALTAAFPIQILIIAIGVGTGVGINAYLSKMLGEGNKEEVNKVAGNGIFLALVIFLVFLLFGIFGVQPYMELISQDSKVIEYGVTYLRICCCFSLGSIGYTVYERFLQATGKTTLSMISQLSGALVNIILDAWFILGLKLGVSGAAIATVIGQFISLGLAMIFHYGLNKEINGKLSYIKPSQKIITTIYKIGLPAAIMQALLACMMFVVLLIINTIPNKTNMALMTNSFGIYYKIMQMALFACFGLSNTLITVTSFNYGMNNKERVNETIKYGLIFSVALALIITLLFEVLANPIANLFGLSLEEVSSDGIRKEDIINTCQIAIRISSIGYCFMALSVGIQGIMQGLRNVFKPLIISFLRLIVFVVPFALIFTKLDNVSEVFWWTFPLAETLTAIISIFLLINSIKNIKYIKEESNLLIITVSRTHGSGGKEIAKEVASLLGVMFYDKENYIKANSQEEEKMYSSKEINAEAFLAQAQQIRKITEKENCVICGRAANYILRDKKPISIFIDAPLDYRIKRIMEIYSDNQEDAKNYIIKSDTERANYYQNITGLNFGDKNQYTYVIDSSRGIKEAVNEIVSKIKKEK